MTQRRRGSLFYLAVLLALPFLVSAASAETVHFPSATTPPTPLQQRLFQERGQPIASQPTTELVGDLYRPVGTGPFPAVVLLHGCAGRSSKEREDATGARFAALGYALLIVDSFQTRGITQHCVGPLLAIDRAMDAYGGLLYLAGLPFIDPDRIAVIGYSEGAIAALSAVALAGLETLFDRHFRTAIAYYPLCGAENFAVPTLILIGERDDWTPAHLCQEVMAKRSDRGAPVRLFVYPDAYHSFNSPGAARTSFGHHLEYNEAADRAAWGETVAALRAAFGR